MAIENPAPTNHRTAKVGGQRLLVDTGKMTVRRVTKSEGSIMSALKSLAPVERSTLLTVVDTLQAKKRRPARADNIAQ